MRYSNLFTKTAKIAPADADSVNAKLLSQAGFIDKQMAGVYTYLTLGLQVLRKIEQIIREEMDKVGNEILLPVLVQKESWTKTKRHTIDILFHLQGWQDINLVLSPTHEEVVTPLMKKFIFSYKDLPKAIYQIQTKFRNEPRAKSGLLRGREFNMKDLYSFHTSEADLNIFYEKIIPYYFNIYERLGLKKLTLLTFASGGVFSKYSHEFQTLSEAGEDTIYICEKCSLAINKEIIKEQSCCPQCDNRHLQSKKAIEVGNIFKLGTRFSDVFDFKYMDKNGKENLVYMGSYGIGSSRLMGTLVEIFHDDQGIIWPESVAPFQVHLIGLDQTDKTVKKRIEAVYKKLLDNKIEVLYDDRKEVSAGVKFADADLIGIPWRIVISKKTKDKIEVKKRNKKETKLISYNEFYNLLR